MRFRCSELYVETHENVSILFADICSFTSLTTTLSVDKLVETLNDLFEKFDDAAEVRQSRQDSVNVDDIIKRNLNNKLFAIFLHFLKG